MDPLAVAATAGFLGGRAGAFLDALLEPLANEIGGELRNRYRAMSGKNVEAVLNGASEILGDAQQSRNAVPGRILFPLLQSAALDEDATMQRRWASLLANSASTGDANKILPAFVETLRMLTPTQAQMLDWMYGRRSSSEFGHPVWADVERLELESEFELTKEDYALFASDLERLQLIEPRRDIDTDRRGSDIPMDQLLQLVVDSWNSRVRYARIGLTTFGIRFVEACSVQPRIP